VVRGGTLGAQTGGTLTLNLTGSSSVVATRHPGGSQGSIGGAGTTINNGNFELNDGIIAGNLTNNSSSFTILGDENYIFAGHLTNNGTITQSAGQLLIGGMGSLVNAASGVYNINDDSDVSFAFQSGTVSNAGTLRKSGGTGETLIQVPF